MLLHLHGFEVFPHIGRDTRHEAKLWHQKNLTSADLLWNKASWTFEFQQIREKWSFKCPLTTQICSFVRQPTTFFSHKMAICDKNQVIDKWQDLYIYQQFSCKNSQWWSFTFPPGLDLSFGRFRSRGWSISLIVIPWFLLSTWEIPESKCFHRTPKGRVNFSFADVMDYSHL